MEQQNVNSEANTETSGGIKTAASEASAYPMDKDPITVRLNIFPTLEKAHYVTHVLRRPTFEEEETRERMMPLITTDAGKVDGADASSMSIDNEPANKTLYDKIIQRVVGYSLVPGEKPSEEGVSPDETVQLIDGGISNVRDLIPLSHKSTAIEGMFPSTFDLDVSDEEFTFALGGGREWVLRQEIGGKQKQEDGTLSPPQYVVKYTFREPTEAERKKFRSSAINAVTLRTKNGVKERRSTNLRVLRDLFDAMIVGVEGATVDGKPLDVRDKKHLTFIPGAFKRGALIKLFTFLEADLGN